MPVTAVIVAAWSAEGLILCNCTQAIATSANQYLPIEASSLPYALGEARCPRCNRLYVIIPKRGDMS